MTSKFRHLYPDEDIAARRAREMEEAGVIYVVDPLAPIRAAADGGAGWAKVLLAANWNPDLHPRGKDGEFIEVFGLVDVFGLHGFQHGQRGDKKVKGQVIAIVPDPNEPGNPIIRVEMTDKRWDAKQFGTTMDVRRQQIAKRTTPKGTIPDKPTPVDLPMPKNIPAVPTPKPPVVTDGLPPPMAPRDLPEHPDSPHLIPLQLPPTWTEMSNADRLAWIRDTMEGDLSAWRGQTTIFDLGNYEVMDPGIAFNMANTYRQLVNWDPETARRIDYVKTQTLKSMMGQGVLAIADPGTKHPGGIGTVTNPVGIRINQDSFATMKRWDNAKAMEAYAFSLGKQGDKPHAVDTVLGDPTYVLIHEFGHQRQFRFLQTAMTNALQPWSPVMRDDGFGEVPDSSNWPEVQMLRYALPTMGVTAYGSNKTSEAYAEAIAARVAGMAPPEMIQALDRWEEMMDVPDNFTPLPPGASVRRFDELTLAEQNEFWQFVGPYLDVPGMRIHYPDTADAYDAWVNGAQSEQEAAMMVESPAGVMPPLSEAPEPAQMIEPFKSTTRNMSERQLLSVGRRIVADVAAAYGHDGPLPEVEIYDFGDDTLARAETPLPDERGYDLWPNGAVLISPYLAERMRDKELGISDFRTIAHEAVHAVVQGRERSYPGIGQAVTEGGAEILSTAYWARNAPAFGPEDAVRLDGEWVHGDVALAHRGVYKEWTAEVMKRAASRVGWDAQAIVDEVQRLLPDRSAKLEFRDTTDPNFPPPPGVEDTPEDLLLWLIGDLRGEGGEAVAPPTMGVPV